MLPVSGVQQQHLTTSAALIAVTFDVEMCRNFPTWDHTDHWDYQKAELDEVMRAYTLAAARRLNERGVRAHFFVLGRSLEQRGAEWMLELLEVGHRLGNHTYDHIDLMAQTCENLQFRFQRSPWLVRGRELMQMIEENIRMTTDAMETRLGIRPAGFRGPYSFDQGLSDRDDLQDLLRRCGFSWASTQYPRHAIGPPSVKPTEDVCRDIIAAQAHAQPFVYPSGLIEIPMSPISDIFAFRNGRWRLEWFLEVIGDVVRRAMDETAVFDLLLHPACLVAMDPEFRTLDTVCDLVAQSGGRARFADLDQIASQVGS